MFENAVIWLPGGPWGRVMISEMLIILRNLYRFEVVELTYLRITRCSLCAIGTDCHISEKYRL